MFNAFTPRSASAYQRINVETSMHTIDQHQLVSLLLEGLLQAVATARGALVRSEVIAHHYAQLKTRPLERKVRLKKNSLICRFM